MLRIKCGSTKESNYSSCIPLNIKNTVILRRCVFRSPDYNCEIIYLFILDKGENCEMALTEKIIELVLDKVLLGGIVLVAGHWLNKRFEIFKNETNEKYYQRQLIAELENQQKQQVSELENEIAIARHNAEINLIERQISEFYWPIYLRLEKDNVMWKRIKSLSPEQNVLPEAASDAIEKEFILKNHQEMVEIIESKIHLAENANNSKDLINELLKYIKHVAVYKTIRSVKELQTINPVDLNEPFPDKLFPMIESNFRELQNRYEYLKNVKFGELKK
ncbi:hypothetical protein ACN23B_07225 [Anabaena sp. FACHB-709]|uniref:Uncharacterized protein n=2 Tax=Nostocaceae TaxID=1162 RepID=A0A1Z4KUD7_ANAVA|nr:MULTISPECIES: hypothetical protein [Nostocaceae]BAB73404.1 alr1447 [Nostoc sp. PCC 7120 = FACHB-418]BAY72422.1 hypothetical protein NIES23_52470 [Trichormus variabilis NIES-23]